MALFLYFLSIFLFSNTESQLTCPSGTFQIGGINDDIGGCGLTSCNARYSYDSIEECQSGCENYNNCNSFTWAPLNGDRNHLNQKVCTFYSSIVPNQVWGPNQIFCGLLKCPIGSSQIGSLNADIAGCGLTDCDERYSYEDIDDCREGCLDLPTCNSFSWAPLGGDQNHVNEEVCTFYSGETPNRQWGPNQILCDLIKCPPGSSQVGNINADIAGCGLTSCNARYSYNDIEACQSGCENFNNCNSYTWAPLNGDRNHLNEKVCTFYSGRTPNRQWGPNQILCDLLKCPPGSYQVGSLNADIAGCGLTSCNARYSYENIEECQIGCESFTNCNSFSWAPFDGDRNHVDEEVCTFYSGTSPNRQWGPNQILCNLLKCPSGTVQIGGLNADIGGCGLTSCGARYSYDNIEECRTGCENYNNCNSFTWAPLGGDRNHKNEKVCTFYSGTTPNQIWGPNQILCQL